MDPVWAEVKRHNVNVGGLYWFIRPSADCGEMTSHQRQALDAFIRNLPSFLEFDQDNKAYLHVNPDPNWLAAILFTSLGVYCEWDDFSDQWCRDGLHVYDYYNQLFEAIEQDVIDGYGRRADR